MVETKSNFGSAVDWSLAATVGSKLAPSGPKTSRYTADAALTELAEASRRAEGPVREVTGLADGLPVPDALILDRPGWITEAAASMGQLIGAGAGVEPAERPGGRGAGVEPAERPGGRSDGGFLGGKPAGVQAGAMLAFLSTAILGQYDPFTGPDGTLLLVAPNIISVERSLRLQPSDFRLWVCLHEVTHRVQFSSSPWLAGYMKECVGSLSDGVDEPIGDVVARLSTALRKRSSGEADPSNHGIVGLLRATQAEPQREALDRLLMLGTLLEGHADHVMDAVGPAVVPSVVAIRKAFDSRRTRKQNPVQRLIKMLLGMDAKMAQYVRGKAFVDAVVGTVGMERFNVVWTDAQTLPRTSEIDDPNAWIRRVLG